MSPSNTVSMTAFTPPGQTSNIDYVFLVKLDQACSVKMAESIAPYTVFTNGGHAGKNWCLVMKARRWRVNKNCK